MANKKEIFSPKVEIINHFDELINRVDIDIDERLEKYFKNENQVLGELDCFKSLKNDRERHEFCYDPTLRLKFFDSSKEKKEESLELWSESTKVVDYLKQVRMRTIEELRKEQEDRLKNSSNFSHLRVEITDERKKEELKSQLFAEKFYFQVNYHLPDCVKWVFKLYTFVTDFYLSPSEIDYIEKFINEKPINPNLTLDNRMILLICLPIYSFGKNFTEIWPNHVIRLSKQELSKIKAVRFYTPRLYLKRIDLNFTFSSLIDLSKLEELRMDIWHISEDINIEGFPSLKILILNLSFFNCLSFKNLYALQHLSIKVPCSRKSNDPPNTILFKNIREQMPNINGFFYEIKKSSKIFNLSVLKKELYLRNLINEDLINCFSNEIETLHISEMTEETFTELINSYYFPNVLELDIKYCKLTKLEKGIFDRFSLIRKLTIYGICNNDHLIVEHDAFSNLKQLTYLELRSDKIESLDKRTFSELVNLETLDLGNNLLEFIDENMFSSLKKLRNLDLSGNKMEKLDPKSYFGLENLLGPFSSLKI